ncbi:MAG: ATPase, T2SS/T4P/T4SS family [Candidatus Firestonebacteria bacterium]
MLDLELDKAAQKLLGAKLNSEAFISLLPLHSSGLYSAAVDYGKKERSDIFSGVLLPNFENIVFNAGSLEKNMADIFENSLLIFLVVTPDLISLKAAESTLSKLAEFHINLDKVQIILNKTHPSLGLDEKTVEKMLHRRIACSIPFGLEASISINNGKPLVLSAPDSPITSAIKGLARIVESSEAVSIKFEGAETVQKYIIDETALKEKIHLKLIKLLSGMNIDIESFVDLKKRGELEIIVKKVIEEIFASDIKEPKDKTKREILMKEILQEALGLGPLEDLIGDSDITEIMVNSKDLVYVEKKGKIILSGKKFISDKQLLACIERIVAPTGRRIDESVPMVDARLLDGSRVNAIIPPLALKGPSLTIRKFSRERLGIKDLIRFGSITASAAEFLRVCVLLRKNIVISGGTGSGKTTLLNIVSSFIPKDERIITIEDSAELNLLQEHVVTLESRLPNIEGRGAVTIRELVKNTLRMRPDRIVVGECRGGEALDMLQAMNTGHDGSLTTLHSNSPRDALSRLETMVLMSGMELPLKAIREQIASAVDLIVHQERFKDGTRRITHITEIADMEGDVITTQDLFVFKQVESSSDGSISGKLLPSGIIPGFIEEIVLTEKEFDRSIFIN